MSVDRALEHANEMEILLRRIENALRVAFEMGVNKPDMSKEDKDAFIKEIAQDCIR